MIKQFNANKARLKRHMRSRNHLEGTQGRPRLSVFRSGNQIYAQVIDDITGRTLAAASSLDATLKDFKPAPQEAPVAKAEEPAEVEEVEVATSAAPAKKSARTEKAKAPAKNTSKASANKAGTGKKTVLANGGEGGEENSCGGPGGYLQQP